MFYENTIRLITSPVVLTSEFYSLLLWHKIDIFYSPAMFKTLNKTNFYIRVYVYYFFLFYQILFVFTYINQSSVFIKPIINLFLTEYFLLHKTHVVMSCCHFCYFIYLVYIVKLYFQLSSCTL